MLRKKTKQLIAALTLGVFLAGDVLSPARLCAGQGAPWAGPMDSTLLNQNPFGVQVSEEAGSIGSFFQGSEDRPLVIHLVDAHGNISAQKNTARMIGEILGKEVGSEKQNDSEKSSNF
ncbi:MAG: hypothetical protein KBC91_07595, partial [Candidatus Omnitrophica bacterium]|nr:hypothetical protein [Candidatus Omnitrophota bacterium]